MPPANPNRAPNPNRTPNPAFAALSREEQRRINQMTPAQLRAHNQAQRGGGGGAAATPDTGGTPAINYRDPNSISGEVARQGLAAGSDPTTRAAQGATQAILAGQGGAGSGTGYQNYNPINDTLAQNLLGSSYDSEALLREFIGNAPQQTSSARSGQGYFGTNYAGYGPGGAVASGGGAAFVPDTVGGSDSYFATQLRSLMDSQANDADLQGVIDSANADVLRNQQNSLWDLDAAAQGTGRLGGDTWRGLGNQARSDAARQMASNASGVRLSELENRRALYQNLLGQVNTRDLSAMQDTTQRANAAMANSSARAGSGSADAAAARAQNLQAILAIQQGQQYNRGQLAGLGGQLSSDQINAIQQAPGLAGINLSGLGQANNAAGTMVGLRSAQIQGGAARAATNATIRGQDLNASMFNAQQQQEQVNSYLRTVLGLGGLGGTSTTQGTNVIPGLGVNPTGAAIQGGLGAGLAYYGNGGR
jgi:hypothetical protein